MQNGKKVDIHGTNQPPYGLKNIGLVWHRHNGVKTRDDSLY